MHGNTLAGGGPVTPNPGTAWQAISTGDFNHDGFSDILLQNTNTGAITIWDMNGTGLIGGGTVRQSRTELARHRNRGRRLRHPASTHERPGYDLGYERNHDHRRRPRQPQSRPELACNRADLTRKLNLRWPLFARRGRPKAAPSNDLSPPFPDISSRDADPYPPFSVSTRAFASAESHFAPPSTAPSSQPSLSITKVTGRPSALPSLRRVSKASPLGSA